MQERRAAGEDVSPSAEVVEELQDSRAAPKLFEPGRFQGALWVGQSKGPARKGRQS